MNDKAERLARSLAPGLNVHRLVATVAIAMGEELFEIYARDNATYKALKEAGQITRRGARKEFIKRVAPKLYEDARKHLTEQLGMPEISELAKQEIYEALILDNELRANRMVAKEQATVPARLN